MNNNYLLMIIIFILCFSNLSQASYQELNIENIKNNQICQYKKNNSVESPNWDTGDSWIYYLDLSLNVEEEEVNIIVSLSFGNLKVVIEDKTKDFFIISLNSEVFGNFLFDIEGIPRISGDLSQTKMKGLGSIDINNYSIFDIKLDIEGKLKINLIPIKLNIDLQIDFIPPYSSIKFPFEIGNYWTTNWSDISIVGKIDLPGITSLFPSIPDQVLIDFKDAEIGGNNMLCTQTENIELNIGEYTVYNISIDNSKNFYYSSVIGNIVKVAPIIIEDSNFYLSIQFELLSTTYKMPGAPDIPERPSGPNQGKINTIYNYSTTTNDLEGDDIFYFFNWGDGNNSGWIGPKKSGEIITSSHQWENKGTYKINVKAKDINNYESHWSESFYFSTPKNKSNFITNIKQLIEKKSITIFQLFKE
jgi:hypothetical protein